MVFPPSAPFEVTENELSINGDAGIVPEGRTVLEIVHLFVFNDFPAKSS
jgi:hypothetical protein